MARVALAWVPALLIMAVIFIWSAQHSPIFASDPIADFVVKKVGHFVGYAVLAVALAVALAQAAVSWRGRAGPTDAILERRTLAGAWAIATAYAATDELHQAFVSGRSASIVDVAIDAAGAAAGLAILERWRRRRLRRVPS